MAISLICPQWTQAGDVYKYTDENGNTVISNDTIPERFKAKAQKIDSYREPSTSERKGLEKGTANRGIDKQIRGINKQIQEIDGQIYSLNNDPNNIATQNMGLDKSGKAVIKTRGLKKVVVDQIIKLRELKADIISKAQGGLEKGVINREIDKQIQEIDGQIYSLNNDPNNIATQNMGLGV